MSYDERDTRSLFDRAEAAAERINAGKAYSPPMPAPDTQTGAYAKIEDCLTDRRTIAIAGVSMDAIDGGIGNGYYDFDINSLGRNLTLKRVFNTDPRRLPGPRADASGGQGLFGYGWSMEYETYCVLSDRELTVVYTDSTKERFARQNGGWRNQDPRGLTEVAREDEKRKTIVLRIGRSFYTYFYDGRLAEIADNHGNALELRYIGESPLIDRIISSCGMSLRFAYSGGRIVSVTDHAGRAARYAYEKGRLAEVEQKDRGKWKLSYNLTANALEKITDPNGHACLEVAYDRKGNITALCGPDGAVWETKLDERSETRSFTRSGGAGRDGGRSQFALRYDRSMTIREMSFPDGERILYDYDKWGNLLKKSDSKGGATWFAYDEFNRKILESRAENGKETEWRRWLINDRGLLEKYWKSNGYEEIRDYDQLENLVEMKTKTAPGEIAAVSYKFDGKGRKTSETDACKNTVKYRYRFDHSVFPETTEYANGFCLERAYDNLGRLIWKKDLDAETRYVYNNLDHVVQTFDARGRGDFVRYDSAGRLMEAISPKAMWESRNDGRSVRKYGYLYNEAGEFTAMVMPSGRIAPVKAPEAAPEAKGELTARDSAGNVLERWTPVLENPKDCDKYIYTRYTYDKKRRLIKEERGAEPVGFSELPASWAVTDYEYDDRDNPCLSRVNSGARTKRFFKGADRLVKETVKISEDTEWKISYEYDELGLLAGLVDWLEFRDADMSAAQADSSKVSAIAVRSTFAYDEDNRLIGITLPNGARREISYDEDGNRLDYGGAGAVPETAADENAAGGEPAREELRDKFGRVLNRTYPDGRYELFEYDFADNMVFFRDRDGNVTRRRYNSINRLREVVSPDGSVRAYLYNAAGEATGKTRKS